GLPYEFEADFQATYTFIDAAIKQNLISGFQLNKYFVVPVSLFARYPEKYGIELVRIRGNYARLVEKSWKLFSESKYSRTTNFQLFRFNEIQGRSYQQIIKETEAKAGRMEQLAQTLETNGEVMILRLMEIAAARE
ncbi:MAG TPA: hypothetical protein VHY08_07580, partial [Bacillota bacterium]|nr:hypothetical protein [Bacillota bacterium]